MGEIPNELNSGSHPAEGAQVFRILVVDDNPAAAVLLREVMKAVRHPYELRFACDGVEALNLLRGDDVWRPHLILLDINMPRLDGIETLLEIKSDPDLCVIPVIMLSTSSHPAEIRRSYHAHANCYVQKPGDLGESVRLVQAIEAFWMDFAIEAPDGAGNSHRSQASATVSQVMTVEASSQIRVSGVAQEVSSCAESRITRAGLMEALPGSDSGGGCAEHRSLLNQLGTAVGALLKLHEEQLQAIIEGDTECNRFDLLIHMANERKQQAKYAYLRHVETHGCLHSKCH